MRWPGKPGKPFKAQISKSAPFTVPGKTHELRRATVPNSGKWPPSSQKKVENCNIQEKNLELVTVFFHKIICAHNL